MTDIQQLGLRKVRRVPNQCSDTTGIIEFAPSSKALTWRLSALAEPPSTLREAGIEVRDVSDVTGFPEMMDGRVKTAASKKFTVGCLASATTPNIRLRCATMASSQ